MVIYYILLTFGIAIAAYTAVVLTMYLFKFMTNKEVRYLKELELKERAFNLEVKKYEDSQKIKEENVKNQKATQKASEAEHKAFFDLLRDPTKLWEDSENGNNRAN